MRLSVAPVHVYVALSAAKGTTSQFVQMRFWVVSTSGSGLQVCDSYVPSAQVAHSAHAAGVSAVSAVL
jgi:hypothetical protein